MESDGTVEPRSRSTSWEAGAARLLHTEIVYPASSFGTRPFVSHQTICRYHDLSQETSVECEEAEYLGQSVSDADDRSICEAHAGMSTSTPTGDNEEGGEMSALTSTA